jgi:hypothetical protein
MRDNRVVFCKDGLGAQVMFDASTDHIRRAGGRIGPLPVRSIV